MSESKFLKSSTVSNILNISEAQLTRWARIGVGPPVIKLGRKTRRYDKDVFMNWLSDRINGIEGI